MAVIPTLLSIYDLARATLADVGGDVYTDTVLAPFAQRACYKATRYLRAMGAGTFRKQSADINLTSGITSIGRSTSPALPTDLVRPIDIRERKSAGTEFNEMRCQVGFLPSDVAVGEYRQYWDWLSDTIVFPAATGANVIQIQYEAVFTDPTSWTTSPGTSDIGIPDGGEAVALLTASYAFASRDERENAANAYAQAMEDLQFIASSEQAVKTATAAGYGGS